MPYAVIGVRSDAVEDGPGAVETVCEGFTDREAARDFRRAMLLDNQINERFSELYTEEYHGDLWKPSGGRCFVLAVRFLKENRADLLEAFPGEGEPVYVAGDRKLIGPDGTEAFGRHAWVEIGNRVFDRGSYITQPGIGNGWCTKHEYYEQLSVVVAVRKTLSEIEADERKGGFSADAQDT